MVSFPGFPAMRAESQTGMSRTKTVGCDIGAPWAHRTSRLPGTLATMICLLSAAAVGNAQLWGYHLPEVYRFAGDLDNKSRMCFAGMTYPIPEDISAVGLDVNGDIRWHLIWGSPWGWRDICWDAACDSVGDFYVVGESRESDSTRAYMTTLAIDTAGAVKWVQYYIEPESTWGAAYAVCTGPRGKVYVTGKSGTGQGPYWMTTLCYDTSGVLDWHADYHGPNDRWNRPWDIAVDEHSNVYITGESDNPQGYHDYATVKYDSTGEEAWSARYNDPSRDHEDAYRVAVDRNHGVVVVGNSSTSGDQTWATVKYDSSGNEVWVRQHQGTKRSWNIAQALAIDSLGNVFVGGAVALDSGNDICVVKYGPTGDTKWTSLYGLYGGYQSTLSIALDTLGYVYAASSYYNGPSARWVTAQIDSAGGIRWRELYSLPVEISEPSILLLDEIGCIYVGGYYMLSGAMGQIVLKYANPNTGVVEWPTAGFSCRAAKFGQVIRPSRNGYLLDIAGRKVAGWSSDGNARVRPGVYFLVEVGDCGVKTTKVIVE